MGYRMCGIGFRVKGIGFIIKGLSIDVGNREEGARCRV